MVVTLTRFRQADQEIALVLYNYPTDPFHKCIALKSGDRLFSVVPERCTAVFEALKL